MDARIKSLRNKRESGLSKSFPTRVNGFACLNTSTDSLASSGYGSPRLGRYRKIPNTFECDVCSVETKDVTNYKCLHSFCQKCLECYEIVKDGCPVCNNLCSNKDNTSFGLFSDKYSPEKEAVEFNDDLIFDDFDDEFHCSNGIYEPLENLEKYAYANCERMLKKVKQEINKMDTDAEKEIRKIREHVEKLKRAIEKKAEIMVMNIHESKTRHTEELLRQERVVKKRMAHMDTVLKQYRQQATTSTEEDNTLRRNMTTSIKDLIKLCDQIADENVHIRFSVKPFNDCYLESITGRVGVRVFIARPLELTLVQTLDFPAGIHSICPVSSSTCWIGYQHYIQLCSKDGKRCRKIDLGEDVHDLSLDKQGNLLIACSSGIKMLNAHSDLITLFRCDKVPRGVAYRGDGQVITCEANDIVVYNLHGERICVLNEDNKYDMKLPYKIAVNVNGDLCVSDYQSSSGEVSIFDQHGRIKARILTEGMAPRGLACNHQGFIYVSDFRADRVNIYSTHGHFLQTALNSNQDGLSGPLSVAIDSGGDLWVGDWKRRVRVYSQRVVDAPAAADTEQ